ncbi:MAG: DNA repair protein RadA, partial [Lachnospiraceae bacterium]|nr:DNA repair protein RadA [Lachnospiraceae bacterium]
MAKKMQTVFFCQECGYESSKWLGQCPACKQWNTLVEETIKPTTAGLGATSQASLRK